MQSDVSVTLARRPTGQIEPSDFAVAQCEIGPIGEGEVLIRPSFISLDPYLSIQMYGRSVRGTSFAPGDPIRSRMVGRVVESRHAGLQAGDMVRGIGPWQSHFRAVGSNLEKLDNAISRPELYLSLLGTSGITAWIGMHRIARIACGETLIVSGATGTIGSIVGQMARRHGCRVVGIAGGPEKCAHAMDVLHFEHCLDHRNVDFASQLREFEAQVYFENVGGTLLDAVLPALSDHARIALCGMIAHYDSERQYHFRNLHLLLEKVIEIRPYRVSEHADHHAEAMRDLAAAASEGAVVCDHTIASGLESAPEAFVGMMRGKALGKSIVQVLDASPSSRGSG